MDRELGLKFAKALNGMEGKSYIRSVIAYGAAPTIEGKKPSSLMTFNSRAKNAMNLWKRYGEEICGLFGLDWFVLKSGSDRIVVLLYRKRILECYVNYRRNQPFLKTMGYEAAGGLEQKLQLLRQRFEKLCPHEVGIFLGIPVEDVEGFIHHKGKNCLMCKYWKVYGNPQRAELLFKAYDTSKNRMAESIITSQKYSGPARRNAPAAAGAQ
jgi:hypothetical protein